MHSERWKKGIERGAQDEPEQALGSVEASVTVCSVTESAPTQDLHTASSALNGLAQARRATAVQWKAHKDGGKIMPMA